MICTGVLFCVECGSPPWCHSQEGPWIWTMFKCMVLCNHRMHPSIYRPFPHPSRKPEPIKCDFLLSSLPAPGKHHSVLVNLTRCFVQEGSNDICPSGSWILILLYYLWTVLGPEPSSIMYTRKCSTTEPRPSCSKACSGRSVRKSWVWTNSPCTYILFLCTLVISLFF